MSDPAPTPPGWYHAAGDPPGTQRYWDGTTWQGGPQMVATQSAVGPQEVDPGKRIIARLIDYLLWAVWVGGAGVFFGVGVGALGGFGRGGVFFAVQTLFSGVITWGGVVAYETFMVANTGATVGMRVMGLKVQTVDGQSPDVAVGLKRSALLLMMAVPILSTLLFPVLGILGLISLVFLFTDPLRQTLWDKIANTVVVAD